MGEDAMNHMIIAKTSDFLSLGSGRSARRHKKFNLCLCLDCSGELLGQWSLEIVGSERTGERRKGGRDELQCGHVLL